MTVASGGILAGTGTVGGAATINFGGTVAPGTLGAVGKLTLASASLNGTTAIKLNKSASPATNDVLAAAAITLGGALQVTNIGPTLHSGDSFTLFSGTLSGSIIPAALPPLWPGLSWDTGSLNTLGRISVTGTMVPPVVTGAGVVGGSFTLSGSGGSGRRYLLRGGLHQRCPAVGQLDAHRDQCL